MIACCSNPRRFARRYELFVDFQRRMEATAGISLYCIECAFGTRPFEVTSADNPRHVQVRSSEELWVKENLINVAAQRLPFGWRYMAWIDGDVEFLNPHWVTDTIHALHHYPVVQLFQQAIDIGPKYETLQVQQSFGYMYHRNEHHPAKTHLETRSPYEAWHPGFAYAVTRKAFDILGGLLDFAVLGAGDHHMALAFIGQVGKSDPKNVSAGYTRQLKIYGERAKQAVGGCLGYVHGTILHYFHGKKANRRYVERWQILKEARFDPETDLAKDYQGVIRLSVDNPSLRLGIGRYFTQREEDSIDT